jgi:hypothetical protein
MTLKTTTNYAKVRSILKGRSRFAHQVGNTVKATYRRYRTPKHIVLVIERATELASDATKRVVEMADKVTLDNGILRLYFVK